MQDAEESGYETDDEDLPPSPPHTAHEGKTTASPPRPTAKKTESKDTKEVRNGYTCLPARCIRLEQAFNINKLRGQTIHVFIH